MDRLRSLFNRLTFSYVLDCGLLGVFAIACGALSYVSPTRRAFSVTDDTISYPNRPDTVTMAVAFLASVVAPAVIVVAVSLLQVKRTSKHDVSHSRASKWRRKLWEAFAGLLGLAFSVILALTLTQAMKNLFGKPRPDFLDRCDPDLTQFENYILGGFSSEYLEGTSVRVTWGICKNRNGSSSTMNALDDGFRSFPSGHCSLAFSGLVYLSLFLAAKLAVSVPFLAPAVFQPSASDANSSQSHKSVVQPRSQAAAPPIYLFVFAFTPTVAAIYIASSRFSDYKHHGFDVFTSSVGGALCAWFGFRWYHMPIRRGSGWAWGPRSKDRAFRANFGDGRYHISKFELANQDRRDATNPDTETAARRGFNQDVELGVLDPPYSAGTQSSQRRFLASNST